MNCRVDLADNELLEWLSPEVFTIRDVYIPGSYGSVGVTLTEFSSIPCKNLDPADFVRVVHDPINLKENLSSRSAGTSKGDPTRDVVGYRTIMATNDELAELSR